MSAFIDLTGKRFDRWLIQGVWDDGNGKRRYWRCLCDCGNVRRVLGENLKQGKSRSCDCLRLELTTKHGMINHPAYHSWKAARGRCSNPNLEEYKNYGGRGITFCDRWSEFTIFWKDMGPSWKEGFSIDRINVNGNYEPANCCWATPKEQANNRRDNIVIDTPRGPMNITQAAQAFGIKRVTLAHRVEAGWPESELFKPARPHSFWHQRN